MVEIELYVKNLKVSSFSSEEVDKFLELWNSRGILNIYKGAKLIGGYDLSKYDSFTINDED